MFLVYHIPLPLTTGKPPVLTGREKDGMLMKISEGRGFYEAAAYGSAGKHAAAQRRGHEPGVLRLRAGRPLRRPGGGHGLEAGQDRFGPVLHRDAAHPARLFLRVPGGEGGSQDCLGPDRLGSLQRAGPYPGLRGAVLPQDDLCRGRGRAHRCLPRGDHLHAGGMLRRHLRRGLLRGEAARLQPRRPRPSPGSGLCGPGGGPGAAAGVRDQAGEGVLYGFHRPRILPPGRDTSHRRGADRDGDGRLLPAGGPVRSARRGPAGGVGQLRHRRAAAGAAGALFGLSPGPRLGHTGFDLSHCERRRVICC